MMGLCKNRICRVAIAHIYEISNLTILMLGSDFLSQPALEKAFKSTVTIC